MKKWLTFLLSVIILIGVFPFNALAASGDIPKEMLDNPFLDALAYTGYDVQAQIQDGTLYKKYASSAPTAVRSKIGYGTGPSGLETVKSSKTPTGYAPDIAKFEEDGLCCASYVSYVYYNYLVNVIGLDMHIYPRPENPRSSGSYKQMLLNWVKSGNAKSIPFTAKADGSDFQMDGQPAIGTIIVFKSADTGVTSHVALYAGKYGKNHFVFHVGNSRGPEICTISGMTKGDSPETVELIVVPRIIEAPGSIEIYKTNEQGAPLAGAAFVATSVADPTKQYVIGPTDKKGYAVSEKLPTGQYTVKETVFPTDYVAAGQTSWTVNVPFDSKPVVIRAVNKQKTGDIQITKSAEDGLVSGVSFSLSGTSVYGEAISRSVKTNADGVAQFTQIPIGSYSVSETTVPRQYVTPSPQTITVEYGKTTAIRFENKLKRATVRILKTDAETGKPIPMAGIAFCIKDSEGNIVADQLLTEADGTLTVPQTIPYGTYNLYELGGCVGYVRNTTAIPFSVTENGSLINIEMPNMPQKGQICITKFGEAFVSVTMQGDTYIPVYGTVGLSDAVFDVIAAEDIVTPDGTLRVKKNAVVDTVTTGEDGIARSAPLYLGHYLLREAVAPDGMVKSTEDYPVELTAGEDTTAILQKQVALTNQRQKITVTLQKQFENDADFCIEGNLSDVHFGLYAAMDLVARDGSVIPQDGLLELFGVDERGDGHTTADLPLGDYYIREVATDERYALSEAFYPVSFTESSPETISVCDDDPIRNILMRGTLVIRKTDTDTRKRLTGAVFSLTADGMETKTAVTDEYGECRFEDLPLGSYTVTEITAPAGYLLSDEPLTATIAENGQCLTLEITNAPIPAPPPEPDPQPPVPPKPTPSPKTGDDISVMWPGICALLALIQTYKNHTRRNHS